MAGGVRFAVDRDESDEFEYEKSGRGPRCCVEDKARDLAPNDLLIDVVVLSAELILLCARPSCNPPGALPSKPELPNVDAGRVFRI